MSLWLTQQSRDRQFIIVSFFCISFYNNYHFYAYAMKAYYLGVRPAYFLRQLAVVTLFQT